MVCTEYIKKYIVVCTEYIIKKPIVVCTEYIIKPGRKCKFSKMKNYSVLLCHKETKKQTNKQTHA